MAIQGQDSPPDSLLGQVVDDRYRITAFLAQGGMAAVYVATDLRLDRSVAFKIIHPHLAASENFAARFRREARTAAKVSHPGIVPVYDQGELDGRAYLVMEMIRGSNLRTLLRCGPFSLGDALDGLEQLFAAIGSAHAAGVIHRDLKPENVLVTEEGQFRVADFGLARAITDVSLTGADSMMGTAAYLAPEAALPGQVDQRADIYAVGLIFYEMVIGSLPWPLSSPAQTAYAHLHEDVPPPSSIESWIPAAVDDLVRTLCARDPQERVMSPAALRECRNSIPPEILARRSTPLLPTTVDGADETALVSMPQIAAATAVGPLVPQLVYTSGALPRETKKNTPRTASATLIVLILVLVLSGLAAGVWWWVQYGPGSYETVPAVAGMSQPQAEQILDAEKLTYVAEEQFSNDVAKGIVIDTDPKVDSRIHKSDALRLFVSKGVKMVTVPDVQGKTVEQAASRLKENDLNVSKTTEVWSEDVELGLVVSSSPAPGTSVAHDSPVTLTISKGPEPVDVPNLVGLPSNQAVALLADLGLKSEITMEYSSGVPAGQVISQSPTPDEGSATAGTTVSLVVSQGSEMVQVPDVTGLNQDEATTALTNKGFEVEVRRGLGFFQTVASQEPRAGDTAAAGSTVVITVR